MNNKLVVEVLTETADRFFHPENGEAEQLRDEFNQTPEFIRGQERGHQDAHSILLGLADYFMNTKEMEQA